MNAMKEHTGRIRMVRHEQDRLGDSQVDTADDINPALPIIRNIK